jgi:hypothetical protein
LQRLQLSLARNEAEGAAAAASAAAAFAATSHHLPVLLQPRLLLLQQLPGPGAAVQTKMKRWWPCEAAPAALHTAADAAAAAAGVPAVPEH